MAPPSSSHDDSVILLCDIVEDEPIKYIPPPFSLTLPFEIVLDVMLVLFPSQYIAPPFLELVVVNSLS